MTSSAAQSSDIIRKVIGWIIGIAFIGFCLVALYKVYHAGHGEFAIGGLVLLILGTFIYTFERAYTWRYLFPGLTGFFVFVIFPLIYTFNLGFSNYGAKHLLNYDRTVRYFEDETYTAEGNRFKYTVHPVDSDQVQLVFLPEQENGQIFMSEPISLDKQAGKLQVNPITPEQRPTSPPLQVRELIKRKEQLQSIQIEFPDGSTAVMTSFREFAPRQKLYQRNPDDSFTNAVTGDVLKPNHETGYFENQKGEIVPPGFIVNIGMSNFERIFKDPDIRGPFMQIFGWTVTFAALSVVFTMVVGMTLGCLLNWQSLRFRTTYRVLLMLPYAVPRFISILIFRGLFNLNFGEINLILDHLFGIKPAWFAEPFLAKSMILVVNTWLGYPYMMLLTLGMLQSISSEIYEASALDGAGPVSNFTRITFPLIIKPMLPLLLASFAFNFNNFVLIALLTRGRPDIIGAATAAGETDILVSYTWRIAFDSAGKDFGFAAAVATVIFFIVAVLSLINFKAARTKIA
jgi:maltose/maltodextrin transport system permease protein